MAQQDNMKGLNLRTSTGHTLYDSSWIAGVDYYEDEARSADQEDEEEDPEDQYEDEEQSEEEYFEGDEEEEEEEDYRHFEDDEEEEEEVYVKVTVDGQKYDSEQELSI